VLATNPTSFFHHLFVTGGVTGRVLALFFVAHYKRASILVLSLVSVLACSIFIYMVYLIDSKLDFTLSSVCSS
jgi:hypothetical protein